MKPRVLLVEDDDELRGNLVRWLGLKGYDADGVPAMAAALEALSDRPADVVVTDLVMPGGSGLELQDALLARFPRLPIIFLTGQATLDDAVRALREGRAFDFLTKPLASPGRLVEAIDRALATRPVPPDFTPRERDIVSCLLEGLGNEAIARRLAIEERTVRNRLTTIYAKLGVESRVQAILACQAFERV